MRSNGQVNTMQATWYIIYFPFDELIECKINNNIMLTVQSLLDNGRPAKYLNFPNRSTESGQMINAFLTNQSDFAQETIHLLFTINRWESKKSMEQLLREGTTLVVDRYSYSGIAYSMAKGKHWLNTISKRVN